MVLSFNGTGIFLIGCKRSKLIFSCKYEYVFTDVGEFVSCAYRRGTLLFPYDLVNDCKISLTDYISNGKPNSTLIIFIVICCVPKNNSILLENYIKLIEQRNNPITVFFSCLLVFILSNPQGSLSTMLETA